MVEMGQLRLLTAKCYDVAAVLVHKLLRHCLLHDLLHLCKEQRHTIRTTQLSFSRHTVGYNDEQENN